MPFDETRKLLETVVREIDWLLAERQSSLAESLEQNDQEQALLPRVRREYLRAALAAWLAGPASPSKEAS